MILVNTPSDDASGHAPPEAAAYAAASAGSDSAAGRSAELNSLLLERPGLEAVLRQLASEAVRATFGDVAAIVLTTDDRVVAAVATDDAAADAERWEREFDEGPALQSLLSHTDFMVADIRHDPRWQRWGPHVAEAGLLSLVSKRLRISNQTFGVLNLYSRRVGGFEHGDLDVAEFFARYASTAIASALQRDALLVASDTRHAIGIAEGILMQRYALSAEAAFTSLRQLGQDNNTTLLVTAEQLNREHQI
jgi:GAF domain-containing protein